MFTGVYALTSEEFETLESGLYHVQLHTETNQFGELRGQLVVLGGELGAKTHSNCLGCHGSQGEGSAGGTIPPLAGHIVDLYRADREYLPLVVLFGVVGEIKIAAATYSGTTPGWARMLSDEEIKVVLNHELSSFGNAELLPEDFERYSEADIALARDSDLQIQDVYQIRLQLELYGN